ncbi:MAG: ribosomal protein S18-alanine N-acetyltransferase [Chamaesiphon sp.]
MTFLELKPLIAEQLPAVVELDKQCFGGHWTLEGYRRELASSTSHFLVLSIPSSCHMSPTAETLVGLGCFWSILEEAHITLLAIHPASQRQGLGYLLLYALLRDAKMRGLERATLEVRASNQAALSLYQKFGFQEAGRRRRYYQDTGEDALILWHGGLSNPEFAKILVDWHQQISARLDSLGWHLLEVA